MNIYFSSDFHYGHKNIVKGISDWEDKSPCRDFNTMEEHNETLIQNINKTVSWDSVLYFMGDWSLGGRDSIWKFRNRLYVRTIHFIGGNHDHHIRNNSILKTDDGFRNARSFFTSYNEILEKKIGGQSMVLCHYPMRSWHKANRGSIQLYGHEHDSYYFYDNYKSMNVGIDTHPQFRPYHLEEILFIMKNKDNLGHHERINEA